MTSAAESPQSTPQRYRADRVARRFLRDRGGGFRSDLPATIKRTTGAWRRVRALRYSRSPGLKRKLSDAKRSNPLASDIGGGPAARPGGLSDPPVRGA